MKIKFDGWRYYAFNDGDNKRWLPFWYDSQGDIAVLMKEKFDVIIPNKEYVLDDDRIYFQNCGGPKTCSALWPNPDCGHCGGVGVGATVDDL